jgi:RNA 3'-terminal phosphate cyclase (ATP)
MSGTVTIDGSFGEGGGQILRTSLSLAAMTGKPLVVENVRARRSKPGLQAQHLTAVRAAAQLCGAFVEGAELGATRFTFTPQMPVQAGHYTFDIGTAGATTLVVQTVLVPLWLTGGESVMTVRGGTHVPNAPTADYLTEVYLAALRRVGLSADAESPTRYGFFPKGGGVLSLKVAPSPPPAPIDWTERGRLVRLTARVVTGSLPDHAAERGQAAVAHFIKGIGREVRLECVRGESLSPGAAVQITVECENGLAGFAALGERGKPMEKVAEEACRAFLAWWKTGAACDEHLSDQWVLPMAVAVQGGGAAVWVTDAETEHLRTVLAVAAEFLPLEYALEPLPDSMNRRVRVRASGG